MGSGRGKTRRVQSSFVSSDEPEAQIARIATNVNPSEVDSEGTIFTSVGKVWQKDGCPHRLDGPAYEGNDGTRSWWVEGQRHREDGPAVVHPDGREEYWLNGDVTTWKEIEDMKVLRRFDDIKLDTLEKVVF